MYVQNLKFVALPVLEIGLIVSEFWSGALRTPNLREEEAIGGRGLYPGLEKT